MVMYFYVIKYEKIRSLYIYHGKDYKIFSKWEDKTIFVFFILKLQQQGVLPVRYLNSPWLEEI